MKRRLVLAAVAVGLLVGVPGAAKADVDWACAWVAPPADIGVCVTNPLPERLPLSNSVAQ